MKQKLPLPVRQSTAIAKSCAALEKESRSSLRRLGCDSLSIVSLIIILKLSTQWIEEAFLQTNM